MNSLSTTTAANATQGSAVHTLHGILEPEINIAVQQRSVAHLEADLQVLLDQDFSLKSTGTSDEILATLRHHFAQFGRAESPVLTDVRDLLVVFGEITQAHEFRVLLSTVHNNMCRRFHTDINHLRMLCTYRGAGTLWVAEEEGSAGPQVFRDEDGIARPPEAAIRQAQAGDVLILKGALFPNGQPVMHRSPPIEDAGGVRLLLRIDTNERLFD
ncbi:MAG: DUF1826 domain-containing protein [Bacteroidota bacterium]